MFISVSQISKNIGGYCFCIVKLCNIGFVVYNNIIAEKGIAMMVDMIDRASDINSVIVLGMLGIGFFLFFSCFFKWLKRIRYLKSDLGKIDRMDGLEFENYLFEKFKSLGFQVELTPASKDFGADLILTLEDGFKIAIQSKRYEDKISLGAIQEVYTSLNYYGCDKGMVITNSYYTSGAITLADCNNVLLWDRDALKKNLIDGNWDNIF